MPEVTQQAATLDRLVRDSTSGAAAGPTPEVLAHLLDVEAIRNLGCLYSRAVDDREHDVLVDLFASDGRFVRRGVVTQGWDALTAMWQASARRYAYTRHVTYNHVIVPAGDAAATGWAAGQAELALHGGESLLAAYRYDDLYRKVSGRWRFEERVLSFSYVLPAAEFSARLGDPQRIRWPDEAPERGEYP